MKKLRILIFVLVMCAGLTITGFADTKAQTKTIKLDDAFIYSKVGPVDVTVTYTGWLGEIDMPEGIDESDDFWLSLSNPPERKVQVIKAGSEVRFTVRASDPAAYYNIAYEKGEFEPFTFDDCGGGRLYSYEEMDKRFFSYETFVIPDGNGTARYLSTPYKNAEGKKTGTNSFSIKPNEGLMALAFNGKTPGVENWVNYGDIKARYMLGTVLALTEEQIADLSAGKTPSYEKNVCPGTYKYDYPGLMELFGEKTPEKEPLEIFFDLKGYEPYDNGLQYSYKLTNNTSEHIKGYYALLSYKAEVYDEHDPSNQTCCMNATFHPIDIDLPAGESVREELMAGYYEMSRRNNCWIEFDSKAERDRFLSDSAIYDCKGYYDVIATEEHNLAWLENKLGTSLAR